MSRYLSAKDRLEAQRLHAGGATMRAIAKRLGRSHSTISRVLRKEECPDVTTNTSTIGVRLTPNERDRFAREAARHGLTMSDALRRLVRHSTGVLDMQHHEIATLKKANSDLNKAGLNLLRLMRMAEAGKLNWNARDTAAMADLVERVGDHVAAMIDLIVAARRRAFITNARVDEVFLTEAMGHEAPND